MAGHTSEKRWRRNQNPQFGNPGVSDQVAELCKSMLSALTDSRAAFLELQEMFAFAGGTTQLLADQLFLEDWTGRESDPVGAPGVIDTQANALELAKVQDLSDAITALNELHQAADSGTVAAEDRYAQLRRMS